MNMLLTTMLRSIGHWNDDMAAFFVVLLFCCLVAAKKHDWKKLGLGSVMLRHETTIKVVEKTTR